MSVGLVQTYRAFAYNNAWANHRLLGACAELAQGEFEAERTGFFPSLQGTLNHIYVVDLFYVDALEGGWLGPKAWETPIPFPTLAELSEAQASIDQRFIGVCNALTPDLLSGEVQINRGTRVQVERRDRLLMHLIQHQIHHRGQAHAMLSGSRIKPPQLDEFFSIAEAPLRASEFADLGWTEETVWGAQRLAARSEVAALGRDVWFAPVSGHRQAVSACPSRPPCNRSSGSFRGRGELRGPRDAGPQAYLQSRLPGLISCGRYIIRRCAMWDHVRC